MTGGRRISIALLLALPAASLLYLAWDLHLVARVPDMADWEAAAAVVREGYRKGDCVVFAPPWAQEGAPLFSGLDVFTTETVDWYLVGKHRRLWMLTMMGHRSDRPPDGFREIKSVPGDRIDVHLYNAPHHGRVIFDFLKELRKAEVTRIYKDHRRRCRTFRDDRWYCGAVHPWQFVGRRVRDIAGAERDVIWAHPLDHGDRIEVRYPAVPAGRTLVVHYGLTQRAIESGEGAPVTFQVRLGEDKVLDRTLGTREDGWFEDRIEVSDRGDGPVDISFTVFTANHKDRQFCFTADMWQ